MSKDEMSGLLQQLRSELHRVLGEQIEAIYLYGSQARGDARPDSDVDVLVVLRDDFSYFEMVERAGEIAARLSLQYDTVISLAFSSLEKFSQQKIPFLLNIRQEATPALEKEFMRERRNCGKTKTKKIKKGNTVPRLTIPNQPQQNQEASLSAWFFLCPYQTNNTYPP